MLQSEIRYGFTIKYVPEFEAYINSRYLPPPLPGIRTKKIIARNFEEALQYARDNNLTRLHAIEAGESVSLVV